MSKSDIVVLYLGVSWQLPSAEMRYYFCTLHVSTCLHTKPLNFNHNLCSAWEHRYGVRQTFVNWAPAEVKTHDPQHNTRNPLCAKCLPFKYTITVEGFVNYSVCSKLTCFHLLLRYFEHSGRNTQYCIFIRANGECVLFCTFEKKKPNPQWGQLVDHLSHLFAGDIKFTHANL